MLELSDSTPPPGLPPLFVFSPSPLPDDTPPSDPPAPPEDGAPAAPGYEWEKRLAFRNTFLLHFTQPGDREMLERLGNLWFEMALECADKWPEWPESSTRAEMRAAADDLHHTAAFLASVGHERHVSSLESEDERLALMASSWAEMVERLAKGIESVVLPLWKGKGWV